MHKKTLAKLAGFGIAAACTATLIGFAANGTGAYFIDSHSGQVAATTGTLALNVSPADGQLSFSNLVPGQYVSQTVNYADSGTVAEDVWLVFPTDGSAEAFVGNPSDTLGGGLGRYGHLAISSSGGANFTSFNLNNPGTGTHSGSSCPTDPSTGWGGSNDQPTNPGDTTTAAFCAPPNEILLSHGLTNNGHVGFVTFTFGFTPLDRGPQDTTVSYKIVGTQPGIRPDDQWNQFNPNS